MSILGMVLSLVALAVSCYSLWNWTQTRRRLFDEIGRLRAENFSLRMKLAEYEVENE